MTNKLTLTIDDKVIESAKKHARQQGKSLSAIVENYLKAISKPEHPEPVLSPRIAKLKRSVKLPNDLDYEQELAKAIAHAKAILADIN